MVSGGFACPTTTQTAPMTLNDTDDDVVIGTASAMTDYLHGPPAAPTGFTAHNAGPDARRVVWDDVTGAVSYDHRYTADETDDDAWTDWEMFHERYVGRDLDMGVEYTFELRALGDVPCRGW